MRYIIVLLMCLTLSSCSKFLEEYTRDLKYAENADDLNKLMIGEAFLNSLSLSIYSQSTMGELTTETGFIAPWLHVMDDDCEQFVADFVETSQPTPLYMLSGFHNWAQSPAVNILNMTWEESSWRKFYKRTGALNAIIFQASKLAESGDQSDLLKHLRGEAHFLRAYYYFMLQNIYGSPYRKNTAATDPGVPLKVSEKIEDNFFSRDPNQKVYDQIIADLQMAAGLLDGYNPNTKIRIGIAAVKALQSRVYLYTEQYDKVIEAAKDFETMGYSLVNLNHFVSGSNFTSRASTETIFTMGTNVMPAVFLNDSLSRWNGDDNRASSFKSSVNLMDSYDPTDLRLNAFFDRAAKSRAWIPAKYRTWRTYNDPDQVSCIFSFRLAEVVLNRAEALAMSGADGEARTELHKLRVMRLSNADISQLPQGNQALVEFIREERRRELCFEGHRWFDLRRYAVNSKYPLPSSFTIRHPAYRYDAQSNTHTQIGNYVLKSIAEDGAAWQVPIPDYAIEFNRGSLTNPVRNIRQLQP